MLTIRACATTLLLASFAVACESEARKSSGKEPADGRITLQGRLSDGAGEPLADATLTRVEGALNASLGSGKPANLVARASAVTDSDGGYTIQVPRGDNTIEVAKDGNVLGRFSFSVNAGAEVSGLEYSDDAEFSTFLLTTSESSAISCSFGFGLCLTYYGLSAEESLLVVGQECQPYVQSYNDGAGTSMDVLTSCPTENFASSCNFPGTSIDGIEGAIDAKQYAYVGGDVEISESGCNSNGGEGYSETYSADLP